jgi:hypothetical protein
MGAGQQLGGLGLETMRSGVSMVCEQFLARPGLDEGTNPWPLGADT